MQVGFISDTREASCPCHKGQWLTVVYFCDPVQGRVPVAGEYYPDQVTAEKDVERFTRAESARVMAEVGRPIETAIKIETADGDEALAAENRYMRNNNPDLN